MRICFISPKAYPLFNPQVKKTFGGAEVQMYLLATALTKNKNLEIHFLVSNFGQPLKENIKKVSVWNSFDFSRNILWNVYKLLLVVQQVRADIYIQRALTPQTGVITLLLKLMRKRTIYMIAHDTQTDGEYEKKHNFITSILANLTFRFSDIVIVQNSYQKEQLRSNKKISAVILNSSYPISTQLPSKRAYTLWVGRSEPWKRPELFLELARSYPQEKFVIICPPSTENPQFSEDIKKKAKILSNVKFIDFVPFDEIDYYFEHAKMYVTTSISEGFQNTLIQATKSKVPILSLNVNPNEFITKYKCGFVTDNDMDALKTKFQEVLERPELLHTLSENAYKYAKENHDIVINSAKFLKIITK